MRLARYFALLVAGICMASTGVDAYQGQQNETYVALGSSTRLIMHSDEKKISFPAKNYLAYPVLFHAQVLNPETMTHSQEFITFPEVAEIKPQNTTMGQILRLGGDFPDDRETLFYVQGHFLPGNKADENNEADVYVSYALQMKLFFRPAKLKASFDAIDDHAHEMKFKIKDGKLIAFNESPYFFTLNTLNTDKEVIDVSGKDSMIKPFGQQAYQIKNTSAKTIHWTLINDGGFSTKLFSSQL